MCYQFIFHFMHTIRYSPPATIPATILLLTFLTSCFGNVTPFDPSTIDLVMKNKIPSVFLLTSSNTISKTHEKTLNKDNANGIDKHKTLYQFHQAANIYYEMFPQKSPQFRQKENYSKTLLFVISDTNDGLFTFERLAQYLGVYEQQTPTIIYLSSQHQKYKLTGQKVANAEQIIKFLALVQSNQYPIFYKSQPLSIVQKEKTSNKTVKPLVGLNFYQQIFSTQKQLFVLFYIPFNFKSRVLKVQFQKAAQSLTKNKNILFRKVNTAKNQIVYKTTYPGQQQKQYKIIVQNDPLIKFWPKNKKQKPVQFHLIRQYDGTYDYMINWLKQMTSYQWVRPQRVSQEFVEEL